ncbi:hypothetical protein RI129_005353 [Pyrocoelia pectoralis]|uniref:Major facilitator superfamily (MFS) profile domain-containing protein n=1 Tax=Pyrocoelia pectoralis TaxID=417401 RepID=A0AAN7VMJ9_9COLE
MSIGYVTILIPSFTSMRSNETIFMDETETSWLSAITYITCLIGSMVSGVITESFGRKRSMTIFTIPFLISWISFNYATKLWHIFAALFLHGLTNGLVEAPILVYVAEVTEPHLRGMLSVMSSQAVILGIFLEFIIGSFLPWKTAALVTSIVPVVNFCLLLLVPETPYWLLLHNKENEARKSLAWLRGASSCENGNYSTRPLKAVVQRYLQKSFLWPLCLVAALFLLTSFCGVVILQTYGVIIIATLKVPMNSYYATVLMGLSQLLGSILCVYLVRLCGKRILALISFFGICVCNTCIGAYAYINNIMRLDFADDRASSLSENHQWIPLLLITLLVFIGNCGVRSLPWAIIGEIFSNETRAMGCGFAASTYYIFTFAANKVYLSMISSLTFPGVHWSYAFVCAFGVIFVYFALPETEGKTLQEISQHFTGHTRLSNKVKRKNASIQIQVT